MRLDAGSLSPEQVSEWINLLAAHPNLAGQDQDIDSAAQRWVRAAVAAHTEASTDNHRIAKALTDLLDQGRVQARMPKGVFIHVPAIYRAFESVVMRVSDVVAGNPQWFVPFVGRGRNDQARADRVAEWHRFLHEQGRLLDRVEPLIRTLFVHKAAMLWLSWDVQTDTETVRKTTPRPEDDGTTDLEVETEEIERVTYEGMRYEVVDGWDQILDHQSRTPDRMRWVGRRYYIDDVTAQQMETTGWWSNVAAGLAASSEVSTTLSPTGVAESRGVAPINSAAIEKSAESAGIPGMNKVEELWGLWSPDGEQPATEHAVVLLNDVPVMIRKNFLWNRKRPAAVVTYTKDPARLVGNGPLEMALPMQSYLDQVFACVLRSHQNAVAPPTLARGISMALPGSLWEMDIGRIISTGNDPSAGLEPVRFPAPIGDGLALMRVVMTQIEEIVGAPRFWEGSDATGTATEIDTRQVESNKRLTYPANTIASLLREVLLAEHSMSRRFTTERRVFAVLGSDPSGVRVGEIAPEDFDSPIDFIIPGPSQLDMYGLRATRVASWTTAMFPLLQAAGALGDVDFRKIAASAAELMVGPQFAKQIFPADDSAAAMDPVDENGMLMDGYEVEVHSIDDDQAHMALHQRVLSRRLPEQVVQAVLQHIADHQAQQRKKASEQARMAQAAQRSAMMPDRLAPQKGRSGRSGGVYQRPADMMGPTASSTPPGETPGPGRASQAGAADRAPAIPQTVNQ